MKNVGAYIRMRCVEEGDCLMWQGARSDSGQPCMHHQGKTRAMVRRVLYAEVHGVEVPADRCVITTCGQRLCLNPKHLKEVSRGEVRTHAAKFGAYKSAAMVMKRTAAVRKKSHITEEVVEHIRAAKTAREAHEQTGVSLGYVYLIRDGVRRAPLGNPFAGLMVPR